MKKSDYLLLFLIGMAPVAVVSFFQHAPGYMDADYYYTTGLQLARGAGFREPYIWNYLHLPLGIPHPSHAYWMPLGSLLAAFGMKLSGMDSFAGARWPFLVGAGCIPPLTAALAWRLTGQRKLALVSSVFAVFPGFYLAYLGTSDLFGIYMVLGALWLLILADSRLANKPRYALLLGIVSGLMYLARSDGILWFGLGFLATYFIRQVPESEINDKQEGMKYRPTKKAVLATGIYCLGFFVIVAPWLIRNTAVFGNPLPPGSSHALWIRTYDELYTFPGEVLNYQHWAAQGIGPIIQARWHALGQNLQTLFAVQGEIFLAPFMMAGIYQLRHRRVIRWGSLALLLTFTLMTVLFPEQGWRGGYFHSGAALQPLLWSTAPVGILGFVEWGRKARKWNAQQASTVFFFGFSVIAVMLTMLAVQRRVIQTNWLTPLWNESYNQYHALDEQLQNLGATTDDIVLVNNPPGYYAASGRGAIAIPDGGVEDVLKVAQFYAAKYILLEANHSPGLDELYNDLGHREGLEYLGSGDGIYIYRIGDH